MSAPPGFHDAIRAANATVRQIRESPEGPRVAGVPPWQGGRLLRPEPTWAWRSTGDPGLFELWTGGTSVGTVSLLPGYVERRAVLLDIIIDHLNTDASEQ